MSSLELRVAQLSHAAHELEFLFFRPHGPARFEDQLAICVAAQLSVQALRKVSPSHLEPAFEEAEDALRNLRAALEQSGQRRD